MYKDFRARNFISPVPTQAISKESIHNLFGHFCAGDNNRVWERSCLVGYRAATVRRPSPSKSTFTENSPGKWKPSRRAGCLRIVLDRNEEWSEDNLPSAIPQIWWWDKMWRWITVRKLKNFFSREREGELSRRVGDSSGNKVMVSQLSQSEW